MAYGIQQLIDKEQNLSAEEWREALAGLCKAIIRADDYGDPIIFTARPVTELLVYYDSSFERLDGRFASSVTSRNEGLQFLVIKIPDSGVQRYFEQDVIDLLQTPGVRLVGPRCLPALSEIDDEIKAPCVDPMELARPNEPVDHIRDIAECGDPTLDRNRESIGLPELLNGTPGEGTLVSVIDVGFDEFGMLGSALATANYDDDAMEFPGVYGWDYCENDSNIGDRAHGTQMSGLIAASCEDFGVAPGISQSGSVFGMQVFYRIGNGHPRFAGPQALARAIEDVHTLGARVVSMSFTANPDDEQSWESVRIAMANANNVVFVTGPWSNGNLPFPARLQSENMILVGTRWWSNNELIKKTWGHDLQIDAPWAAKQVITPSYSGTSNAIAMVAGAAAELLGRCSSLTPEEVRKILVDHGLPSADSKAKPLLQVEFLNDFECPE